MQLNNALYYIGSLLRDQSRSINFLEVRHDFKSCDT